jgi:hypothetical protein
MAALHLCSAFHPNPPADFDAELYEELVSIVRRKKEILEACLNQSFSPSHKNSLPYTFISHFETHT